ncbi:MAG: Ltp family lipoprotein [Clostridia bacterium]|nr:Ltp family lipoprotein [Clostridia bacterium]
MQWVRQTNLDDDNTDKQSTTDTDKKKDDATMGEKMALDSAENYLSFMGFSRKGLIDQLEFEGYTTKEATYAVDNCGADWKEQAVRVAKNYLDTMPFSKKELIDQLEFEGFTSEEAEYGVEQAYR